MTASISEIQTNSELASKSIEQVSDDVDSSNEATKQNVSAIHTLSGDVSEVINVITELRNESNNIGSVLDVIKAIAEQTNLLALNAAIEAARAGESGRGFAVVADEVRSLAQRTHESTEEIQAMIEALQSEALKAVSVMQSSVDQAREGAGFAVTTGEGLQQATGNVNAVTDRIAQIADMVQQQSAVIEEVSQNVSSIRDISRETKSGSELVSGNRMALNELVQSTTDLLDRYKI